MVRTLTSSICGVFFWSLLGLGLLISGSSFSWVSVWMGLEVSLVGCYGLFVGNASFMELKSTLKYFLIQSVSSGIMVWGFLLMNWGAFYVGVSGLIVVFSIFLKLGVFPFYFWVAPVIEGISWGAGWIMCCVQKIVPLLILIPLLNEFSFIGNLCGVMSIFISGVEGVRQLSIRSIFGFSSVGTMGWVILIVSNGECFLLVEFFLIYAFILLSLFWGFSRYDFYSFIFMSGSNFNFNLVLVNLVGLLSLAGLPPFLGFMPKVLVLFKISIVLGGFTVLLLWVMMISVWFYLSLMFSVAVFSFSDKYLIYAEVEVFDLNNLLSFVFLMMNLFGGVFFYMLF